MGQLREGNCQHQKRITEQGNTEKRAELRAAVQRVDVAEEARIVFRALLDIMDEIVALDGRRNETGFGDE